MTLPTPDQLLRVARSDIGYVESGGPDGRSGNITKFWARECPSCQGQPWCMCFQRDVDRRGGAPILPVSAPFYCPSYVTYAKQHGLWLAAAQLTPGDYYFCDFTDHGIAEHVGRCEELPAHQAVTGIEGNTSSGAAGSQANGGGVYRRTRPFAVVLGGLDYSKLLAHVAAHGAPPRNPVKHNPFIAPVGSIALGCRNDKATGRTQVHWVQWAVGVPCDGVFGDQTDHAVRLFQRQHGLAVDGVVGPATRGALSHITH